MTLETVLQWLKQYPEYTILFIFLTAFFESFALIGLFIPGAVILSGIGLLVGWGYISIFSALTASFLGAFFGDFLSYCLGRYFQDTIVYTWPFSRYPILIQKGKHFFNQHGGKSIFIGRFIGPLRPILPIVAGILNMPINRFIIIDIISGLFWAPAYLLPGTIIALAGFHYSLNTKWTIILGLILLSSLWILHLFRKHSLEKIVLFISNQKYYSWQRFIQTKKSSWLYQGIVDPIEKNNPRPISILLQTLFFISLFLWLSFEVVAGNLLVTINKDTYQLLQNYLHNTVILITLIFTSMGESKVLISAYLLLSLYLLINKKMKLFSVWILNSILVGGILGILKYHLYIPRPPSLVLKNSYSFPSAHVALSVALIGLFLHTTKGPVFSKLTAFNFILFIFLMVCSRLYLQYHWLTDVLGGLLLGLTCFSFSRIWIHTNNLDKNFKSRFFYTGIFIFLFVWLAYSLKFYEKSIVKVYNLMKI